MTRIADAFFNVSALISNFTVPSSTEFPVIKEFFLTIAIGNVEGQEVNDSVWRNWVPDDDYLIFRDSSVTNLVNLQWPEE